MLDPREVAEQLGVTHVLVRDPDTAPFEKLTGWKPLAVVGVDRLYAVPMESVRETKSEYFVRVGGYIHKEPWYLPAAVVPEGADRDAAKRAAVGRYTPWFDLRRHAGDRLHGQLQRSGGVAEFPNVTADFTSAVR